MRLFFIGDIIGKAGRKAVKEHLPALKKEHDIDLVVANAENLAGGKGATEKTLNEMEKAGVDFFTSGNHIFSKQEVFESGRKNLIRPANYPQDALGEGYRVHKNILFINLLGRIFINALVDCPLRKAEEIISAHPDVDAVIIDFHAEATSEKYALKCFLDGKATAIFGTHTHVATADAQISEEGTFFVCDVGMTGPLDSIIGVEKKIILKHFLTSMPVRHKVAEGKAIFQGFILDIKDKKAHDFRRISKT